MYFLLLLAATVNVVVGQSCNGGRCVTIHTCPEMVALVNKPNRTPDDIETLRKASCGFEGSTPKVCCPEPCFTPEGATGKCVSIYSCQHLASLLQPPVTQENAQYVQRSRCNGPAQYSVCCGPPRTDTNTNVEVGNCPNRLTPYPPDPRSECCGIDSSTGNKIVGGKATGVDQYPWLVIIEYARDSKIKLLCGGALISNRYVLTAAHCVTGAVLEAGTPKNVRLGEYDTSNEGSDCIPAEGGGEDCSDPAVILSIERSIPHPDYDSLARKNDIALIRMAQLAPYTDFIRPICLPTNDITLSPPPAFRMFAAGWGAVNETVNKSNVKLHVELPFVSREKCQPVYNVAKRRAALWEKQLCAGGEKNRDSCKGDSGGPLMYENGRIFELIGVVSFGPKPCGVENIPGVYTKVYEYNGWIRNTIRP